MSSKVQFILLASHRLCPDHMKLRFQLRIWRSQKHRQPGLLGFDRDKTSW